MSGIYEIIKDCHVIHLSSPYIIVYIYNQLRLKHVFVDIYITIYIQ